jgi:uncharacterized membrane protein YfcA
MSRARPHVGHVQGLDLADEVLEDRGREGAGLREHEDALAEGHDRRDRRDLQGSGQGLLGLGVDLAEDGVGVLRGGLLEDRPELTARATPGGPEVDEDDVVVQDGPLEGVGGEFGCCHGRDGLVFGVVGAVGTVFGTTLARRVDGHTLLLAFAGLLLVVAAVLWRRASAAARPEGQAPPALAANRAASIMGAATAVGLLTGFFGVGGGFAVVPALVIALGFTMREAVATSLLVLTLNTASALVARAFGDGLALDWSVIAPFTVATVLGSFVGARLGPRLPDRLLQRSFAILLVGVGVYTAWQSLT